MGVVIPHGALSCVSVVLDSLETPRLKITLLKIRSTFNIRKLSKLFLTLSSFF